MASGPSAMFVDATLTFKKDSRMVATVVAPSLSGPVKSVTACRICADAALKFVAVYFFERIVDFLGKAFGLQFGHEGAGVCSGTLQIACRAPDIRHRLPNLICDR